MEAPKAILNCKYGYFSIARHFGGINFQGKEYVYYPVQDALIRKDLEKKLKRQMKQGKTFEESIKEL